MNTAQPSWTAWLRLPGEYVLAVVGVLALVDPALWLVATLAGYPPLEAHLQIAAVGFAVVVAPLFVGEVCSLSRLWDYVLVLVGALVAASLLALAGGLLLGSGGLPTSPTVHASVVATAYLATIGLVYGRGLRL